MRFFRIYLVGVFVILVSSAAMAMPAKAPEFKLQDLQGRETTLQEILKDKKAVLLNFWATWCPSCRRELPELVALQKKWAEKGFTVAGVDVAESSKKVSIFKERYALSYPLLLDSSSETAKAYAVVGLPASILVDAKGNVLGRYSEYSEKIDRDLEKNLK